MQENQQNEQIKRMILFKFLTKKARERINIVRSANPKLAQSAEMAIIAAIQKGTEKVDDEELKKLLQILSQKRKTKIKM